LVGATKQSLQKTTTKITKEAHKKHKQFLLILVPFVGFLCDFCDLLAGLLEEFGDEAGPARLMARTDAGAVVAVEVFVEGN